LCCRPHFETISKNVSCATFFADWRTAMLFQRSASFKFSRSFGTIQLLILSAALCSGCASTKPATSTACTCPAAVAETDGGFVTVTVNPGGLFWNEVQLLNSNSDYESFAREIVGNRTVVVRGSGYLSLKQLIDARDSLKAAGIRKVVIGGAATGD
jgi:biopolymer transport protein ExbD